MIDKSHRVHQSSRAAYRDLQEGGVILHLDTGQYHRVNATGRRIWSKLVGDTIDDLIDQMRGEFPQQPPDLDKDVIEFLHALYERGLIEVGQGQPDESP